MEGWTSDRFISSFSSIQSVHMYTNVYTHTHTHTHTDAATHMDQVGSSSPCRPSVNDLINLDNKSGEGQRGN